MAKYRKKGVLEAVQWNPCNWEMEHGKMIPFLSGGNINPIKEHYRIDNIFSDSPVLYVRVHGRVLTKVFSGEYVVKLSDDRFVIMKKEEFEKKFEEIIETPIIKCTLYYTDEDIINLHYTERMTAEEISKLTNKDLTTIKLILLNALGI